MNKANDVSTIAVQSMLAAADLMNDQENIRNIL